MHCYTHGEEGFEDILLAQKICKHFGIDYSSYSWDDSWLKNIPALLEQNAHMFNGNNDLFYIHVLESLKNESRKQSLFVSGVMGNQLLRHHPIGNSLPKLNSLEESASFIYSRIPSVFNFRADMSPYYENLFANNNFYNIVHGIKQAIAAEISTASNYKSYQNLPEYFLFKNYSSNIASNMFKVNGKYLKVVGAFYHKDLLQQAHLHEIQSKTNGTLQRYIIKQNNEYLGNLPYVSNNRVVKYSKIISNLVSRKIIHRNVFKTPSLTNYSKWIREHNPDFIREVFRFENMESNSLFDKVEFEKLISKYISGKYSITNKKEILHKFSAERFVYHLVSLELWIKSLKKAQNSSNLF